jgi:hypothetical protein
MEAEGMVHALEEIRRLLTPDGYLIDIHPIREEPLVRIYQGSRLLFSESDPGYDYDESLQQADKALEDVVRRSLYRVEHQAEFEVVTYASSVSEMRDYWSQYSAFDDEAKDETITARQDEMFARADEIMRKALDAEITYHERARIARLIPIAYG